MVVSTWEPTGSVYILSNLNQDDPEKIVVKRIAKGLAEPLGVTVVDDVIYVLQKQELTRLVDNDGDEMIDQRRHAKICRSCSSITWIQKPIPLGNWGNRTFWECGCTSSAL